MLFTDDDLKRLKDMISGTRALWVNNINIANPLESLIARLEVAEYYIENFGGHDNYDPVKHDQALNNWRKHKGEL